MLYSLLIAAKDSAAKCGDGTRGLAVAEGERASFLRSSATPADPLAPPGDGSFDRVAHLAAAALRADVAMIELIDGHGVWHHRADRSDIGTSIAIRDGGIDPLPAPADLRRLSNPVVAQDHGFVFYACVPLQSDGVELGKVVILDRAHRDASDEEVTLLRRLGDVVIEMVEWRTAAARYVGQASTARA